jgi:hypothetical protein
LDPYFIFKGANLWDTWCTNGPNGAHYNVSPSGWMEAPQFVDFFKSVVIPYCKKYEGPKLLIFDGHASHISLDVIRLAKDNNIHLLALPAHSSHVLQPLDYAVYGPVKKAWRKIVDEYFRTHSFRNVEKSVFASLYAQIKNNNLGFLRRHIVAGFEATGIFPFNPKALDKKKLKTFNLAATVSSRPVASSLQHSTSPKVVSSSEPVDSRPSEPVDSRPSEPVDSRPSEPVDSRPSEPVDSRSSEPVDSRSSEPVDSALHQTTSPIVVHAKPNSLKRTFLSSFPDECIFNESRDADSDEESLESLSVYSGEVMDYEDNEDEDESMEISDSDESESGASVRVVSRANTISSNSSGSIKDK